MSEEIFYAIGGIGMFLVGMEILTSALRDAAGSRLRTLLARFTTTPLRGVLTGALGTAIIQSSSATTVLTVGFVGAGLLSMGQALGIIYGANIGTTATGWLVSLVGFKLNLDNVAFALLLPGSLLSLLGRGTWARLGRGVSGLCLLIIGLDLMQTGLADLGDTITPRLLQGEGISGFLLLVAVGLILTVVMQSSSAAMALALVMLQGGMLGLIQAIALVIGMNIGTTFTAILASVGGSRPMRQTAIANLIFNCATALMALPLLALSAPALEALAERQDAMTALLVFHTGFNIIGTAVFLPLTQRFSQIVARLVPEEDRHPIILLDQSLLEDPDAALVGAQGASEKIAQKLFGALGEAMQPQPDYRGIAALVSVADALSELEEFLSHIRPDRANEEEERTFSALLHQTDHMARLLQRAERTAHVKELLDDPILRRPTLAVGAVFRRLAREQDFGEEAARLDRLHALVRHRKDQHRRGLLLGEHAGIYSLKDVFAHTDAMRWLDRSLHHAERVAYYQVIARQRFPSAPIRTEEE
ncbi:MAG: Na/Pi cotransporter family protein [Rhodobacteraceae bacterium]|nr:Na/Pi cotransporter family protein [Paracoccaceae bacterium]